MKKQTLRALESSIIKWQANTTIEHSEDVKINRQDCPLCQLFSTPLNKYSCDGCPVADETSEKWCINTPYSEALTYWEEWVFTKHRKHRDAFHIKAQEEVNFLKSLLPTKEKKNA